MDCLQISLTILSEFDRINLLNPLTKFSFQSKFVIIWKTWCRQIA